MKALVLLFLMAAPVAWADNYGYAVIGCDEAGKTLWVRAGGVEEEQDIPPAATSLDSLMTLRTNDGADYLVKAREWEYSCRIGKSTYKILISPWKEVSRVNSMCGAYGPSVQLSVWINEKILLKDFVFDPGCISPDDYPYVDIVTIDDAKRVATIGGGTGTERIEVVLPFGKLGKGVDRARVFGKP